MKNYDHQDLYYVFRRMETMANLEEFTNFAKRLNLDPNKTLQACNEEYIKIHQDGILRSLLRRTEKTKDLIYFFVKNKILPVTIEDVVEIFHNKSYDLINLILEDDYQINFNCKVMKKYIYYNHQSNGTLFHNYYEDVMEKFIRDGGDIDYLYHKETLLMVSVKKGNVNYARKLLDLGANPYAHGKNILDYIPADPWIEFKHRVSLIPQP